MMKYNAMETITSKLEKLAAILKADGGNGVFDLGLVIVAPGEKKKTAKELGGILRNCEDIDLDAVSGDMAAELFINAFKEKKNLIVSSFGRPLSSPVHNLLRRLGTTGAAQIFRGQEEINLRKPRETSVVFLTDWRTIEKNGGGPFLKLFGPALDLSQ